MDELREFYNEWLLSEYSYMPPFDELTDEKKKSLENSLSFARFKFRKASKQFGDAMKTEFNLFHKKIMRVFN